MPQATYVPKPPFQQTPAGRRWIRKQFEWENCDECLRGARGHIAILAGMGPFALCRPRPGEKLSPMQKKAFTTRN